MDRGAWQAIVYRVPKSQTRLSNLACDLACMHPTRGRQAGASEEGSHALPAGLIRLHQALFPRRPGDHASGHTSGLRHLQEGAGLSAVYLGGHVGNRLGLADRPDQAGDVDDISPALAQVREGELGRQKVE